MAKITLSNGWCFEKAYDLNAMSQIAVFSINYFSTVFVNNYALKRSAIEHELFQLVTEGIISGFAHNDVEKVFRIRVYTKHITEII